MLNLNGLYSQFLQIYSMSYAVRSKYLAIFLIFLILAHSTALIGSENIIRSGKWEKDRQKFTEINNLHGNFYLIVVENLLDTIGKRLFRKLTYHYQVELLICLSSIENVEKIAKKARCISDAYENEAKSIKSKWIARRKKIRIKPLKRRRRSPGHFIDSKNFRIKKMSKIPQLLQQNSLISRNPSSIIGDTVQIATKFIRGRNPRISWEISFNRMKKFRSKINRWNRVDKMMDKKRQLFDSSSTDFELSRKMPFLDEIANNLNRNSVVHNYRILSPDFMSIFPKIKKVSNTYSLLSPSVFPLYRDTSSNDILPISGILNAVGLNENDHKSLIDFLMEITGTRASVDAALRVINRKTALNQVDKAVVDADERMRKALGKIAGTYSKRQNDDLAKDGFAFLNRKQLDVFYGGKGMYNYVPFPLDLDVYEQLSISDENKLLQYTVDILAGDNSTVASLRTWGRRQKTVPIIVNEPSILTPMLFAPSIIEPVVLGPYILSPELFSPDVLTPTVLSPPILTPFVLSPFIISPYVLSPLILSPTVLSPMILTPYVLSPNIVNPYVLSPLILSPYVLSPDIASPPVLGGNVLSPHALSPAFLSPSVMSLDVLSPSFLE